MSKSKEYQIKRIERKLNQIKTGKWSEDAESIKRLENKLDSLRKKNR